MPISLNEYNLMGSSYYQITLYKVCSKYIIGIFYLRLKFL